MAALGRAIDDRIRVAMAAPDGHRDEAAGRRARCSPIEGFVKAPDRV